MDLTTRLVNQTSSSDVLPLLDVAAVTRHVKRCGRDGMLVSCLRSPLANFPGAAPGSQGARSAHIGNM